MGVWKEIAADKIAWGREGRGAQRAALSSPRPGLQPASQAPVARLPPPENCLLTVVESGRACQSGGVRALKLCGTGAAGQCTEEKRIGGPRGEAGGGGLRACRVWPCVGCMCVERQGRVQGCLAPVRRPVQAAARPRCGGQPPRSAPACSGKAGGAGIGCQRGGGRPLRFRGLGLGLRVHPLRHIHAVQALPQHARHQLPLLVLAEFQHLSGGWAGEARGGERQRCSTLASAQHQRRTAARQPEAHAEQPWAPTDLPQVNTMMHRLQQR